MANAQYFKKYSQVLAIIFIFTLNFSLVFPNLQSSHNILDNLSYFLALTSPGLNNPILNEPVSAKSSSYGTISGNGGELETLLYLNLSDQINSCNTASDFSINTNGWNISKTDLLFTNLTSQFVKNIEVSSPAAGDNRLNKPHAMSFTVDRSTLLHTANVCLELNDLNIGSDDLTIKIYNASSSEEPDLEIYSDDIDLISGNWTAIPITGGLLLDPDNTNNETFFVVLEEMTGANIGWYYLEDDFNK